MLQVAKTAPWQKLLADLFSPKPQPTSKKKEIRFCTAMLFQTLCRRWTNRHHPLEDANETHG
jgi:hypothetical protein